MTVARVTEISSQSGRSFEDAVRMGIRRANQTLRNITGAWVKEHQVQVTDGRISGYRVNMLVTFVLDDGAPVGAAAKTPAAAKKAAPAKKAPKKAAKKRARRR